MPRILCLGDSNTFGYDPRSPLGGRYPRSVRWTGRLAEAGWEVRNRGQNGLAVPTGRGLDAAEALARREAPDAVLVMLGSNDLLLGAGAEETGHRLRALMLRLLPWRPVLIAPPPMEAGEWVTEEALREESRRLGPVCRGLARELGLPFADAGTWNLPLAFDGVHLLPEGHAAFARETEALLNTLFPSGPAEPGRVLFPEP